MKIEIPDKIYDKLKEIGNEMNTQDNRATADPHFYQVGQKEKLYGVADDFDGYEWVLDGDSLCDGDPNMVQDEYFDAIIADYIDENKECKDYSAEEILKAMGAEKIYYKFYDTYQNVFFTKREIKKHIENNKFHYNETVFDYVNYAFKNPEMEVVIKFLRFLGKN